MLNVWNISAHEAKLIDVLPNDYVLISINEEDGALYGLKLDRNNPLILTLRFCDITDTIHDIKKDGSETVYHPISREDAAKIVRFIDEHHDKNIIVHCAAGISRSGAVALYTHLSYGHELKDKFWLLSEPNPFVLGRLMTEAARLPIKNNKGFSKKYGEIKSEECYAPAYYDRGSSVKKD